MSIIDSGNIIKKIRNGENLDEISEYALDHLFKDGPVNTVTLEILSYIKLFQPEHFVKIENDVIEIMGLFFKQPEPQSLKSVVFDIYSDAIKEKWGNDYTPAQADILNQIASKEKFSFSAPTSTGKSYVFRHIIKNTQNDIAVIVPSRALINEYYDRVREIVKTKETNVLTFVDKINTKRAKRNIFILTPERARELFKNKSWINLDFILFDEAQLGDEKSTRGLYFDSIVRRALNTFPDCKVIFAHPFISNPEAQFEKNNISINDDSAANQYAQKNVGQIFYTHEVSDDKFYHFGTNKDILGKQKLLANFDPIERSIKNGGSVLIYIAKTRIINKQAVSQFQKYVDMCPLIEDPQALDLIDEIRDFIGASKDDKEYYNSDMIDLLKQGVVTHHGSMPLTARLMLEHFTQQGYCRICFATSTLEQGINMPFDVVYIDRFHHSKSLAVKNLIGRAGRSTSEKKFDVGNVVIHKNAMKSLRDIINKPEIISSVSHLDEENDKFDEKYNEFKQAINEGTFNDDYNLTANDVQKIKSDDIQTLVPNLLDNVFDDEQNIINPENITSDVYELFQKLYEQYLGRLLVVAESDVLKEAVKIMLWRITGRTFKKICQIRYAKAANVNKRREAKDQSVDIYAQYLVGYKEIPNKELNRYPLIRNDILAKDVDYDIIMYDTYDFLDKMIGFKLSDIYYAILKEYYNDKQDERADILAKYVKYGTADSKEIWMLRYGFDFEDIEWLKPCVESIGESEIVFNEKTNNLDEKKLKRIDDYL